MSAPDAESPPAGGPEGSRHDLLAGEIAPESSCAVACSPAACSTSGCRIARFPPGAVVLRMVERDGTSSRLALRDLAAARRLAESLMADDDRPAKVQLIERTVNGWAVTS